MLVVVVATVALDDNDEDTNGCAVADSLHWDDVYISSLHNDVYISSSIYNKCHLS